MFEATVCKHCGWELGGGERSASVDIGLESDECPNNVACQIRAHGAESAIGQAYTALRELQGRWEAREPASDDAEQPLTGADLFTREVLSSSALW
jgi:hypothetical protein